MTSDTTQAIEKSGTVAQGAAWHLNRWLIKSGVTTQTGPSQEGPTGVEKTYATSA